MGRWMGARIAGAGLVIAIGGMFGGALAGAAPATASPRSEAQTSEHGRQAADGGKARKWRFDASATTMADVGRVVGADAAWSRGTDGRGVGVALVDTGVVP